MKVKKSRIAKAMSTRFGRFLCRIAGEEKGAVAMEYVIIGLLVAAAVVAIVMIFGETIGNSFGTMTTALSGKPEEAAKQRVDQNTALHDNGGISKAQATGKKLQTGAEASTGGPDEPGEPQ